MNKRTREGGALIEKGGDLVCGDSPGKHELSAKSKMASKMSSESHDSGKQKAASTRNRKESHRQAGSVLLKERQFNKPLKGYWEKDSQCAASDGGSCTFKARNGT